MRESYSSLGSREKEIFLRVLDKTTADARAAYLNAACGYDQKLRAAVEVTSLISLEGQRLLTSSPAE